MPTPALTDVTTSREIRAAGARPGVDALRAAYLELLKLCLCDLAGEGTSSVDSTTDGRLFLRELTGEQLQLRATGMDWPLHALTMVGLDRLDDLQACVESVVAEGVDGDLVEAGTWRGGASILMRATLDSLGADERTVWVADSFEGFPVDDVPRLRKEDELHGLEFLAVPLEEVEAHFARFGFKDGVRFVPGFFEETMPELRARRWSIVRLDGDTYDATWVTLEALYPGLSIGGHLIVDDYGALEVCRQAVEDFRRERGVSEPLEQVDWTCVRWRKETDLAPAESGTLEANPQREAKRTAPGRGVQPRSARIPTQRELELERELSALRNKLAATEAELAQLRRSPFGRLADRLRRRSRRADSAK
jgi:Macrocin-O-methyltransferase (TylF)